MDQRVPCLELPIAKSDRYPKISAVKIPQQEHWWQKFHLLCHIWRLLLNYFMSIQVYGIPNCSTCKKALTWLQHNNIDHEFINTKDTPPTREMIQSWVKSLGFAPMRNTSGQSYRALGDEKKT